MTQTARDVLLQWIDRVGRADPDAVLELYAEHATLLPTFSPHALASTQAISAYFHQLATRSNLQVELHGGSVREMQVGEYMFVLTGVYSFRFDVDEDNLTFPSRFTFVIDVSSARPILHHHSSQVPRTLS
ncbi:MAG: DUF4440 domain-containing protein [Xanthomonadales bacterium]|nr:DUF4440 domain-containing protein [Xanthomonadales bacterium]NIN60161.1 DUF4440 domain-containing protein [Xanthomonadales bacterium]NIN74308.1 DUF4440 domain-containing protein [Xanthomonadales bacterium]NIO12817.1 DUF4440 domain-containing protein [Xanthomonadales bacterium]NIP12554.1 DUF4440 domain-containing protein [Xanthomonadales bacterium]